MANNKNTIQQIPLSGSLNMNTLKTEVKQFEGYNEKNSTVFGGTLSPFYEKQTEIGNEPVVLFNSKGEMFSIKRDSYLWDYGLYKGDTLIAPLSCMTTFEINVPKDVVYTTITPDRAAMSYPYESFKWSESIKDRVSYITDKDFYCNGTKIGSSSDFTIKKGFIKEVRLHNNNHFVIFIGSSDIYNSKRTTKVSIVEIVDGKPIEKYTAINNDESQGTPLFTVAINTNRFYVSILSNSGRIGSADVTPSVRMYCYDSETGDTTTEITNYYYLDNFMNASTIYNPIYFLDKQHPYDTSGVEIIKDFSYLELSGWGERTYDINQFGCRGTYAYPSTPDNPLPLFKDCSACVVYSDWMLKGKSYHAAITGHDGNGFIPSPHCSSGGYVTYVNGLLFDIEINGFHVAPLGGYEQEQISTFNFWLGGVTTYKSTNGKWYCFFMGNRIDIKVKDIASLFKVIDNRYIPTARATNGISDLYKALVNRFYDIETGELFEIRSAGATGQFPYIRDYIESINPAIIKTTGAVYGSGYQAGYTTKMENPFIGTIFNPYIMTNFPDYGTPVMDSSPPSAVSDIDVYLSVGNSVTSAEYAGTKAELIGTYYPVDANANALLPMSINANIMGGYTNNDIVLEGNTAYPLLYYNVNKKIYNYYLLSMMENVEGAFSLFGQNYVFDNNNIYATTYNYGIIQSSTPVAYKHNMIFMGTLPSQAVFYSKFNKSFYAFTGDRILSKMFEASAINEIYYVSQNPSSLSLWICTDNGIYVMSDTDVYKLDYPTKKVLFLKDCARIVVEGETESVVKDVSLYDIGNGAEMVPVKLKTAYYGLGNEQKAVMDCWYIRLFDEKKTEGDIKVKVNTITDVTRHTEEKVFHISPNDYDDNNIVYLRYQPKYQECTAMQLELESPIGIYELAVGVNATDTTAQVSKINF